MRVLLAIFLLLLMLFQTASHFFVFKIHQYYIRKEIKAQIKAGVPKEALILLKIDKSLEADEFQRVEEDEIRYHGEMYDIVRQENHGDTTWYYCIWDEKESELFAQLDEQVDQQMNQNPEQQKQHELLNRLLGTLYLSENKHHLFLSFISKIPNTSYYSFALKIWEETPPTPPPIIFEFC
jgi:hypothetical protein